jgi:hypothetical protein
MSARQELLDAYGEWRRWTEIESTSIRQANWASVSTCQEAKRQLQSAILTLSQAAEAEVARFRSAPLSADPQVRHVLRELITLEASNQEWLAEQIRKQRHRIGETHATRRNVHRVQRSYVPHRSTGWQSYS